MPAGADVEAVVSVLGDRAVAADPVAGRGARPAASARADDLPRLEVASHPPRTLAVVAASERALAPLVAAASRSGWRTVGGERRDDRPAGDDDAAPRAGGHGVLVGAGDPPAADERRALGELAALVAAVAGRRPELHGHPRRRDGRAPGAFGDVGDAAPARSCSARRPSAAMPGGPLADLLVELALPPDDARRALGAGRGRAGRRPRPAGRRRRDRLRRRDPRVGRARASAAGRRRSTWPSSRAPASRRPTPTTRSSTGSAVVDLGRRPASPARPPARAAHRAVGGRDRRRRRRSGWPPPGPRSAGSANGRPEWDDRPPADLDRRDRRRVGRRPGTGRRPGPGRRPPPAGRRPVRPRPRPAPRAARVDPGRRTSAGR